MVQEGKAHGAVTTAGAAYGASALGPSAGIGAGVGAGAPSSTPQTEGLRQQPLPSLKPGTGPKQANAAMHESNAEQDQRGLALPFEPVALVFKDVHYWVKNPNGRGELELLKASA